MHWMRTMPDRTVVIKSPQEIAVRREAGRINALALQTVRELIRPGVATCDLDQAAESVIRQNGCIPAFKNYPGPYPFPASLCISRSEEHTSELQSHLNLVCRLLLEKKKKTQNTVLSYYVSTHACARR